MVEITLEMYGSHQTSVVHNIYWIYVIQVSLLKSALVSYSLVYNLVIYDVFE